MEETRGRGMYQRIGGLYVNVWDAIDTMLLLLLVVFSLVQVWCGWYSSRTGEVMSAGSGW